MSRLQRYQYTELIDKARALAENNKTKGEACEELGITLSRMQYLQKLARRSGEPLMFPQKCELELYIPPQETEILKQKHEDYHAFTIKYNIYRKTHGAPNVFVFEKKKCCTMLLKPSAPEVVIMICSGWKIINFFEEIMTVDELSAKLGIPIKEVNPF